MHFPLQQVMSRVDALLCGTLLIGCKPYTSICINKLIFSCIYKNKCCISVYISRIGAMEWVLKPNHLVVLFSFFLLQFSTRNLIHVWKASLIASCFLFFIKNMLRKRLRNNSFTVNT